MWTSAWSPGGKQNPQDCRRRAATDDVVAVAAVDVAVAAAGVGSASGTGGYAGVVGGGGAGGVCGADVRAKTSVDADVGANVAAASVAVASGYVIC